MDNVTVYDKGKYHYEGNFPGHVHKDQAFVHIGMFYGWVCNDNLYSEQAKEDFSDEIEKFQQRKLTGTRLIILCGGVLASDMLNDDGNAFASWYYESTYLEDYANVLLRNLPSIYHIEDTWENYDIIALRIEDRYREWLG